MRMLSLPVDFVKVSVRSKRFPHLAVAVVSVITILLVVSVFTYKSSSAHEVNSPKKKQQGCCSDQPAILRRMIGSYYTTEDGFRSTLILNNKGPNQIMVTPILHSRDGQDFTASPVAVGGQSSYEVDLNRLARAAGPQFRSGSFEFTYEGRLLEVGGGLRIVNAEKSLIFDEQMLEPGMKFPSSRLEAVYAVPFEDSQVSVIVTNTTAQPIIVNGDAIFAGVDDHHPIQRQLGPYEMQVINLPHGLVKRASAGAVSLNHDGVKGALLAMIHLWDADRGYSESVNFTNPSGKTTERHGAGLRLGNVSNDPLRAVVAVRNIGDGETTVTATVPYSKQNGDTGTISLPQVSLDPGAIKLLDTSNPQLSGNDFATAGLEIRYTGAPGSVIATASSVSRSGNHVFALPMKDPQGGLSSTGGYPWFISGSSSTVVFIKNTTSEPRTFVVNLVYAGGQWGSGLKTIAPGQTFKLDVREVRDSQMRGSEGNAMPLDAVSGHVNWSVRGKGGNKTLIGRAQMVDFSNGLASTYECQCSCPRSFYDGRLEPGGMIGYPGYEQQFLAKERTQDCFGNIYDGAPPSTVFFDSGDWNVAYMRYDGLCTAMAPGSTILSASWDSVSYFMDPNGTCLEEQVPAESTASCDVAPPRITGLSPSVRHVSTGDDAQTNQITVSIEPSDSSAGIIFEKISVENVGGTAQATLTIPNSSGQGSVTATIKASPANSSGVFVVRPRLDFSSQPDSRQTSVIVPPQILIQMLVNEARGLPDNGVRDLLGVSMKNRFGDSTYFSGQDTYDAAIRAGATFDTSVTNGKQPELSAAARVFGSTFDPSSGCQGFWTPTAAQWAIVNEALTHPSTTLPSGTGIPFNYNGQPQITQIVYFPIVGGNPPVFLFVRKRDPGANAVVQINLP